MTLSPEAFQTLHGSPYILPSVNPRSYHAYFIDVHTGPYEVEVTQLRDKWIVSLPSSMSGVSCPRYPQMCFMGEPWILSCVSVCPCTCACSGGIGLQCLLILCCLNRFESTHLPSPIPGEPLHGGPRSVCPVPSRSVGTKPLGSRNPPLPRRIWGTQHSAARASAAWVAALCLNSPGLGCASARA